MNLGTQTTRTEGKWANATHHKPVVRANLKGAAAVRLMADDFRDLNATHNGVTREDMLRAGWTAKQYDELAEAARDVANTSA